MPSETAAKVGKQVGEIVYVLLKFAFIVFFLVIGPIQFLWQELAPALFPGAVAQGLVAPTISWGNTLWIAAALAAISALLKHVRIGAGSAEIAARISDAKLNAIARHLGIDPEALISSELIALIKKGKKIEAIQLYRMYAGGGLAEAKAHIESLERAGEPGAAPARVGI